MSIYVHYPFCRKKCPYCHFFVLRSNESQEKKWFEGILREWETVKRPFNTSLYFGGGTPSLMPPEWVAQLIHTLGPHFEEITLEANPEEITLEKFKAFKNAGVNRLSIGVQSLINDDLILLGRAHTANKAVEAIETAHQAGFNNISIDLMYDLPNQTLQSFEKNLHTAATLPITHLSLYNLTIEPNTPFFRKRNILEKQRPEEKISREMYLSAIAILEGAGLERYEISAFAKEGKRSIHNTGYWLGRPFIGLGPSAFSYIDNKRYRNSCSLDPVIDFEETLPEEERIKERFVIQLRLREGVNLSLFEKEVGRLQEETKEELLKLEKMGWITNSQTNPTLTLEGVLFYDSVAVALI